MQLLQRLRGLQVDDWPDLPGRFPDRCRLLRVTRPMLRGPDVLAVQRALKERGYEPGPLDGVYGGLTRVAVNALQQKRGLVGEEGVVDREVYRELGIRCRDLIKPDPANVVYNNPYGQATEMVWYKGRQVLAVDLGEVKVDPALIRWAREYVLIYGFKDGEPEEVPGQLYIYDSVPGDPNYSPIWRYYYVVVPRDYVPNSIRSEEQVLASGYEVKETGILIN